MLVGATRGLSETTTGLCVEFFENCPLPGIIFYKNLIILASSHGPIIIIIIIIIIRLCSTGKKHICAYMQNKV
jgi:hypothetical protein